MSVLRKYKESDAGAINSLALIAFSEYEHKYDDWPTFSDILSTFSELSNKAQIIVCEEKDGRVIGAVAYVSSIGERASYLPSNVPIIRMLVVSPEARGKGVGKSLSMECINLAKKEGALSIALHTSEIMTAALSMYSKLGFKFYSEAPSIFGVKYKIYSKEIT